MSTPFFQYPLVGATTSRVRTPVFFTPSGNPTDLTAPKVVICGLPGNGRSFLFPTPPAETGDAA